MAARRTSGSCCYIPQQGHPAVAQGQGRGPRRLGRAGAAVGRHARRRAGRHRAAVSNARGPDAVRQRDGDATRGAAAPTGPPHAGSAGAGAGQGPRAGVGQAPRLDPARPDEAAGTGPAAGDPADEPGGRAGAAARPGRRGAGRSERGCGVPGGAASGRRCPVRCAASSTGAASTPGPARAVRHQRAAVRWRSGSSRRRRRRARRSCRASLAARHIGADAALLEAHCARARTDPRAPSPARAAAGPGRRPLARAHLGPHRRGDHRPGRHRQDPGPGRGRPRVGATAGRCSAPRPRSTPATCSAPPASR